MAIQTIYMPLLAEGTEVFVPVQAEWLGDGRYRVFGPMPEDQEWKFPPGSVVRVYERKFSDGTERPTAAEISR
jgi:hypothetical protein